MRSLSGRGRVNRGQRLQLGKRPLGNCGGMKNLEHRAATLLAMLRKSGRI